MSIYHDRISEAIIYLADTLALSPYIFKYEVSKDKCIVLNNYQDILECVEQYIDVILGDEEYVENVYRGRIKIHILPSVGVYKRKSRDLGDGLEALYIGSPLNYYYGLLVHLYEYLTNTGRDVETVILDISHGVNFMPVLGFRAVVEALKLYLVSSGKDKIRLIVFNSDPMIPGTPTDIPRNINIVYCREFIREEVLAEISQSMRELNITSKDKPYIMLKKEKPPDNARKLDEICSNIYKSILKPAMIILRSIDRGLPLPLVYTLEELRDIEPSKVHAQLIRVVVDLLKNRVVRNVGDRIIVEHNIALGDAVELYLELLVMLNTLIDYSKEKLKFIGKSFSYAGKEERIRMYSLDDLWRFSEKYMVSRVARELVSNEVSNIKDRIRLYKGLCNELNKPVPYSCIYDFTEKEVNGVKLIKYYRDCGKDTERVYKLVEGRITCPSIEECLGEASSSIDNERNFYAHAGFYGSATLIVVSNGKVYVGYVPGTNYRDVLLRD